MERTNRGARPRAAVYTALLLFLPAVQADNDGRILNVTCDANRTIGKALRHARPGDTLVVNGTCNENVALPAELHRVTLDGRGTAAVHGTDATLSTFNVKGKDIVIKGFTVTGGLRGIEIEAGGSATVDGNVVQQAARDGILVNTGSSAVIVNNTIQNNPEDGIRVSENSTARIGFRESRDLRTPEPNTIQNNTGRGVRLDRNASARIYGNTISHNGNRGVEVRRASYADISSNAIDANGSDGILVNQNSAIGLGADVTEEPLADDPNRTTVNNAGVGIRCGTNSSADGRRGTLTGNGGPTSFDGSCVNSTLP